MLPLDCGGREFAQPLGAAGALSHLPLVVLLGQQYGHEPHMLAHVACERHVTQIVVGQPTVARLARMVVWLRGGPAAAYANRRRHPYCATPARHCIRLNSATLKRSRVAQYGR